MIIKKIIEFHIIIITFNTTILSAYVLANSSNFGAITLHGPHQVAKKSTITKRSPDDSS